MKKEFIIPAKWPWVLAGIAIFMLIGGYMFGVEGVISMFEAISTTFSGDVPK